MDKKLILKWLKYFIIITAIFFMISIIAGSTYMYLNLISNKEAAILGIWAPSNVDTINKDLIVEGVYRLCTAWYYKTLYAIAYSALASAVISTIICIVKNKKA